MHRIYNRMLALCSTLPTVYDNKTLSVKTDNLLHKNTVAGT